MTLRTNGISGTAVLLERVQVGDNISAIRVARESGKGHLGSWNLGTWPREVGIESRVVPGQAGVFHRVRVVIARDRSRLSPYHAEKRGSDPILASLGTVAKAA